MKEEKKDPFQGIDINALVQQKIKEELEKFTQLREQDEILRKEREEEEKKLKEELQKQREEIERTKKEGEKEKEELRKEREEIKLLRAELLKQKEFFEMKTREMSTQRVNNSSSIKEKSYKSRHETDRTKSIEKSPESRRVRTSPFRNHFESHNTSKSKRINVSPSVDEQKPQLIPVPEGNLDLPEVNKLS